MFFCMFFVENLLSQLLHPTATILPVRFNFEGLLNLGYLHHFPSSGCSCYSLHERLAPPWSCSLAKQHQWGTWCNPEMGKQMTMTGQKMIHTYTVQQNGDDGAWAVVGLIALCCLYSLPGRKCRCRCRRVRCGGKTVSSSSLSPLLPFVDRRRLNLVINGSLSRFRNKSSILIQSAV